MSVGWDWAAPAPSRRFQILDFPLEKRLLFVPSLNEPLMLEMSNSSIPDLSHGKKTSRDAPDPEGERENNPTPGTGICLDLGFLQNPQIPTKLSLDFIQKIPDREFLSQPLCQEGGRKTRNNGIWEKLCLLNPLPESLGAGFPFPNDFSKQIPLFSLLLNQIH